MNAEEFVLVKKADIQDMEQFNTIPEIKENNNIENEMENEMKSTKGYIRK